MQGTDCGNVARAKKTVSLPEETLEEKNGFVRWVHVHVCCTMGSGRGREAWVRERVEWSLCFFFSFFLWWLVCVCNKVRHVIEEEEVCYLIYLRGRQSIFCFREGVVFYKQGIFRYL